MLRVNAINRQELLKCLTFNPKSLVFKTVSVPTASFFEAVPVIAFIFLYTDGLDEAEDAGHRQFGKKRIYEVIETADRKPRELIERMTQAVADFVGDTEQSDDLTMFALQYL